MKKVEIERILVVLEHDDIIDRFLDLSYYFPRHEETIHTYCKENIGIDLDEVDLKGG